MRDSSWKAAATGGALLAATAWPLAARAVPEFVDLIPNGAERSCSNCHIEPPTLNEFGAAFSSAGSWTPGLASADSDDDGFSNGWELQDPAGAWDAPQPDPGDGALVTGPGNGGDVPALPVELDPPTISRSEAAGTNGTESTSVHNVGGVAFDWMLVPDVAWLEPTPASESGLLPGNTDPVLVQFLTSGLADGPYTGNLLLEISGIDPALLPAVEIALTVPEPEVAASALAAAAAIGTLARRRRAR